MTLRVRPPLFWLVSFVCVSLSPAMFASETVPAKRPPSIGRPQPAFPVQIRFSESPSDEELRLATMFSDRLVPMGTAALENENEDLAAAVRAFMDRESHEDVSMLLHFVQQHPASRWNASLLLNIGLERYTTGYLSQALQHWEAAWTLSKDETDLARRAIADRAVGELLLLNARLGRVDSIEHYLAEIVDRPIEGAPLANISAAKEGLLRMKLDPGVAFKCGPFALNSILNWRDNTPDVRKPELEAAQSTPQGTNLIMVRDWAAAVGLDYRIAKRAPAGELVYPAVMHWKLDHFAALLAKKDDRYLVQDATFGGNEMWLTASALEAETDGYFLIPTGDLPAGWSAVTDEEAQNVWGKGGANARNEDEKTCKVPKGNPTCPRPGMPSANYYIMQASPNIQDMPLYYQPPVGPAVSFLLNYNFNETGAAGEINTHSNLGANWDFNWVGFLEVNESNTVNVRLATGGTEHYKFSLYNNNTGAYAPNLYSQAVLKWTTDDAGNDIYRREFRDGSAEVYSQPGQPTAVGRYYLKQIVDAQGNAITINYEAFAGTTATYSEPPVPGQNTDPTVANAQWTGRINEIVDAAGGVTFIRYLSNSVSHTGFRKIKRIIDPYGRTVELTYDGTATTPVRINSITDAVGMTSSFSYASDGFIEAMTTPYGKTLFHRYNQAGTFQMVTYNPANMDTAAGVAQSLGDMMRGLRITYPNGSTSVVESWLGHHLSSFHWNRLLTSKYPLEPQLGDPEQYQNCEKYIWRMSAQSNEMSAIPVSMKRPLQEEVDYTYEGAISQSTGGGSHNYSGSSNQPETTTQGDQQFKADYNLLGNVISSTEPSSAGSRVTKFSYAGNGVDLLEVRRMNGGQEDLLAKMVYNQAHLPREVFDAAGAKTEYTYNEHGQVTTAKDALGAVTAYTYEEVIGSTNPNANDSLLASIDGPLPGSGDVVSFTYDEAHRVESVTNEEGDKTWYEYDNLNRILKVSYQPSGVALADAEYEEIVWDRLNPVLLRDRKGRLTHRIYDEMGQLVSETDSEGRTLKFEWCICGSLARLIDGNGNTTRWEYDALGRQVKKIRANDRVEEITYYPNKNRIQYVTAAGDTRKEFFYNQDDSISRINHYIRARDENGEPESDEQGNPIFVLDPKTPSVWLDYDAAYGRLTQIRKSGNPADVSIAYQYHPYRTSHQAAMIKGAGALSRVDEYDQEAAILYAYDELGRAKNRSVWSVVGGELVDDGHAVTLNYDSIGRVTSMTDALGTFGYTYDQPGKGLSRLAKVTYPNGLETVYSWAGTSQHRRLAQITHQTSAQTVVSQFGYTYSSVGQLQKWTQNDGIATRDWILEHDDADQLRSVVTKQNGSIIRQQFYNYDQAGNRASYQDGNGVMKFGYNKLNQINGRPTGGSVRFEGYISEPGLVSVAGQPAKMRTTLDGGGNPEFRFSTDVNLQSGPNTVAVTARDGRGNESVLQYQVTMNALAGQDVPQYDVRGNMLTNGRGQEYKWDGLNRLIGIVYADGSRTEFVYDALDRRVGITEKSPAGAETSVKRLLWDGLEICEERDAANALTKRYHAQGYSNAAGENFYYTRDHLGSVRQLVNHTGQAVETYRYGPYGEVESLPTLDWPPPVASTIQIRLKADQNVIKDSNNKVSQWNSGIMSASAPAGTAQQPTFVENATPTGKPAIRFDGVDDCMQGFLGTSSNTSNWTLFVVHRRADSGSGKSPFSFSGIEPGGDPDNSGSPTSALTWEGSNISLAVAGTSTRSPQLSTAPSDEFQITTLVKSNTALVASPWTFSASLTLYNRTRLGGSKSSSVTRTTEVASATRYVLGRYMVQAGVGEGFFNGDIAEVIFYNGFQMTASERQAVENYLATIYLPRPVSSDFRYTGHYYHEKSGLHLAPYRAYDATTGLWISEDPIQEAGGVNLYGYVGNNPLLITDIYGLDWHHMVPFAGGLDAGLPPEFINGALNGWDLDKADHNALHSQGWLKEWNQFFRDNPSPTCGEALGHLEKMKTDPKFSNILAKGKPSSISYPKAKARMNNRASFKGQGPAVAILMGAGYYFATIESESAAAEYIDAINTKDEAGVVNAAEKLGKLNPFDYGITTNILATKGLDACK